MASLNEVSLIGHVGRDPEIRTAQSGRRVALFSLATAESWRDRATGERKEQTEWHNIVVWSEGLVGIVEKYVRKGGQLYVRGKLATRKWQDGNGVTRWTTEVTLNGFAAQLLLLGGGGARPPAPSGMDDYGADNAGGAADGGDPLDDEIPF